MVLNFVILNTFCLAASAQAPLAPASVGSPSSHQPIQLSDLQSILATMNVPAAAAAQGATGEGKLGRHSGAEWTVGNKSWYDRDVWDLCYCSRFIHVQPIHNGTRQFIICIVSFSESKPVNLKQCRHTSLWFISGLKWIKYKHQWKQQDKIEENICGEEGGRRPMGFSLFFSGPCQCLHPGDDGSNLN